MTSYVQVQKQLASIDTGYLIFGKPEIRELANILNEDEVIRHCVFGHYRGGSALLVATNRRLLLVDKRLFFVNLEDIRYEMINQVNFAGRLLNSTVGMFTSSKKLDFSSFSNVKLRFLCNFVQDQITISREPQLNTLSIDRVSNERSLYPLLPKKRIGKFGVNAYAQNI